MPIYEYRCEECHQVFEEWQKDFVERTMRCPICGSESHRVISNTSFILKGGGWYASGYCKEGGNGQKKAESGASCSCTSSSCSSSTSSDA
ncbi:hypothetical protein TDMWS_06010 [Thermodesulfomicrobium sp. WS]|uniref:FmdB family zinc ribbon protein n=1 Tax=Thermodesulfomicrobium sp. WS TaxID=3004129 RepID=UPI0024939481|nr:zinc ribbon domain-containing protein [Thermodesulfomicrobium sp. WS]BDV00516.1 hypothetical protein TDMWS_06010 [Thermodesulfomicrobium sp. WS]